MKLELHVNHPYSFGRSVRDHGWIALAPCYWIDEENILERVERLADGTVVLLLITANDLGKTVEIDINVQSETSVTTAQQAEIKRNVHWMLKLNEDLSAFYQVCANRNGAWEKIGMGRGRLLRSPTLFEDVVKTICTTNTTWRQTKQMISRIVDTLGDSYPLLPSLRAFPTPEQVMAGEHLFAEKIRLGYRNEYVTKLARDIIEGRLDLEALKTSKLPINEMKRTLKAIKGIGDYAANTLLMILGHYENLAFDSELRNHATRKYFDGRRPTDQEIAALYEPWGEWKYLAYWFDLD